MIDVEVTKWPVFVLANYRTRSSPFSRFIFKKYQVEYYNEPGQHNKFTLPFLEHYRSGDKKYVVKCMPDQLNGLPELTELLNSDCFKIKITRSDELNQIVSHYVATMTNNWGQRTPMLDSYVVGIDYDVITRSIQYIVNNNKALAETNIQFDFVTTYKDLGDSIPTAGIYKTTQPTNIELIKSIIKRVYEQR